MNVASNNIANVNTEGYSRQRLNLSSAPSRLTMEGLLGSGVRVDSLERIRNQFIDKQLMHERPSLNQYQFKSDALQFIEEIFNEPSDFGLNRKLEDFFNSFQDLANDPESMSARTVTREKAVTLSNGFNQIHRQLSDYQSELNYSLTDQVNEINRLTGQIANLNQKIVDMKVMKEQAPTLRDERDKLVDQLSGLVDVQTQVTDAGAMNVVVAGRYLVVDTQAHKVALTPKSAGDAGPTVVLEAGGDKLNISNGSLKGLLDVRDKHIPDYLRQLDEFAFTLATEVNSLHSAGYNLADVTGQNFFNGSISGADDFAVDSAILSDASLIATSDIPSEPGNNRIALAIANLQDGKVLNNGQYTFNDHYNALVSSVGVETQEANFLTDAYGLTVEKIEMTRDSVSSVSIDEEMTHMIESQQAFAAAAKVVTTLDEMTSTILNMV